MSDYLLRISNNSPATATSRAMITIPRSSSVGTTGMGVAVLVGVLVGVIVGVFVGVRVGVSVGVLVGVATSKLADAVFPVPPFVEDTAPVVLL